MLGALDESDPTKASVIIPNYLNGANNCVAGSNFYDVCCIDECDALISHLEQDLAAPEASAARVINLVRELPSDTVTAPRAVSDELSKRLDEIATHHGGLVPLHGRLFAQWMHHAYPRECPYPHLSGVTRSMTSREYKAAYGRSSRIEPSEVAEVLDRIREQGPAKDIQNSEAGEERALPWSSEEELFAKCRPEEKGKTSFLSSAKAILPALLSVLCACTILYRVFAMGHPK